MSLSDLELRSTQELMDDVVSRETLDDGVVLLVLIDLPATAQRVVTVRRLEVTADTDAPTHELSALLYDEMHALPIPSRDPKMRAVVMTVIVRRGIVGRGPAEKKWTSAWRYSNHNTDAFAHDMIVVTEHGWASLWSHDAGRFPRAA